AIAAMAIWPKPVDRTPRAVIDCQTPADVRSAMRALATSILRCRCGGIFLAIDHPLGALRVPVPLDVDLRSSLGDLAQLFGIQLQVAGSEILLETMQLRGPRDRHDPGPLREHPRERELRRRHALSRRDARDEGDDRLIRLSVFRRKAWHGIAEVGR